MKSLNPYTYFDYPTRSWKEVYSEQNPQPMALYPLSADVTDAENLATNKYYVNTSESAISISGVDISAVTLQVADIAYLKAGTPVTIEIVGSLKSSSSGGNANASSGVEVLFEAKTVEEEIRLGSYIMSNVTKGTHVFVLVYTWNTTKKVFSISADINLDLYNRYEMSCILNFNNDVNFADLVFSPYGDTGNYYIFKVVNSLQSGRQVDLPINIIKHYVIK